MREAREGTGPAAGPWAGDAVPAWGGWDAAGHFHSLAEQAGWPVVVLVLGEGEPAGQQAEMVGELVRGAAALVAGGAEVVVLGGEAVVMAGAAEAPVRTLRRDGSSGPVGPAATMVLVVDRNRRVAMRIAPAARPLFVEACAVCLARLPREETREVTAPAPVLMLPNLIEPSLCRSLIAVFESGFSIEGEVATRDGAGNLSNRVDPNVKNRRDLFLRPGDAFYEMVRSALIGRCAKEIARAFQANVSYVDRIVVARYDAPGGWFRRHRDNESENVAFREFAISVNLNTEEYEGGHLLFPEYNDHRYRPPCGGGIIFSASLLHEVAPVTRGRRYVLLTFFYGEAAEARRLAFRARNGAGPAEAVPA